CNTCEPDCQGQCGQRPSMLCFCHCAAPLDWIHTPRPPESPRVGFKSVTARWKDLPDSDQYVGPAGHSSTEWALFANRNGLLRFFAQSPGLLYVMSQR